MITGAPTATMLLMLSPAARAFVRPVGPAALSGVRWSKVNSASHQARAKSSAPTKMALESEEDKCMYAFGAALATQTDQFRKLLTVEERKIGLMGFSDHWLESGMQLDHSQYAEKVNNILQARNEALEKSMAEKGVGFLAEAAKAEGAVQTASGMVVQTVVEGTGASPLPTDTVKVHYHGTLIDGSVFDSSVMRGSPISFPLNGVIKGWTEGVQLMKVGGKSKLTIPPELAYGEKGTGPIPANATLVFEVELLEIEGGAPTPQAAPSTEAAAPSKE
ncbi:unnamed protein product [Ectocarpus fasciculatus]